MKNLVRHTEAIPIVETDPTPEQLVDATAVVFGAFSGGVKGLILTSGRLVQGLWMGRLWPQFLSEINEWKEQGRIKEDYFSATQNWENLTEMLDYLDKGVPDEQLWRILKKIFFVAASESKSTRDDIVPQQFLRLAKSLNSVEALMILSAYSTFSQTRNPPNNWNVMPKNWVHNAVANSGLRYTDLGFAALPSLIAKGLVAQIKNPGNDIHERFVDPNCYGLTDLGRCFCEYIVAYDTIQK